MEDPLDNKYKQEFTEPKFWDKLKNHARNAGLKVVYTALLMFYAYKKKSTPTWAKNIILGCLGYLLAPIDSIPDLTPIIGFTDDLGVLAFGLATIAFCIDKDVKSQAREKVDKWFDEVDDEELKEVDDRLA